MTNPSSPSVTPSRMAAMLVFLAALPLCVYFSTITHGFVNFDDDLYIAANPVTLKGLSGEGVRAAFGFPDFSYWQPLALLSHQADVSLFGPNPHHMHLLNAILHSINTFLLFAILFMMTGAPYRSAFVAALFAVHPVNAETVAWISERKNLLAVLFWFSAILFYARYVKKPNVLRMIPVVACAALSMSAKPVAITLPLTLILLDFWPLNRLSGCFWKRIAEKLPIFILSGAVLALGLVSGGSFASEIPGSWPLSQKLAHIPIAYARYLEMAFWPQNLCAFHPFPKSVNFFQATGAFLLIAALVTLAWKSRRRMPYLTFGIFWFLGTLLPSSGLATPGHWAAVAERHAYAPYVGLFVSLIWGAGAVFHRTGKKGQAAAVVAGLAAVVFLGCLTNVQAGYWKDSYTLFSRCVSLYPNMNYFALTRLGAVFADVGGPKNLATAERLFLRALAAGPQFALAETNTRLGNLYLAKSDTEKAFKHFFAAQKIAPRYAPALTGLGSAYLNSGDIVHSIKYAKDALGEKPDSVPALMLAGLVHEKKREYGPALAYFSKAAVLEPKNAEATFHRALCFGAIGKLKEASGEYYRAIRLNPDYPGAIAGLAEIETRLGRLVEAKGAYILAVQRDPKNFALLVNLAQVLVSTGSPDKAVSHFRAALSINPRFAPARLGLADALSSAGKTSEATIEYKKILNSSPDDLGAIYGLARTLEKIGCYGQAAAYYRKALEANPGWDAVKRLLDGVKEKKDRPEANCP